MEGIGIIPIIAAGLAFAAVMLIVFSVSSFLGNAGNVTDIKDRISERGPRRTDDDAGPSLFQSLSGFFSNLGSKVGPKTDEELQEQRLAFVRAGIDNPDAHGVFQGIKLVLVIGLSASFLLARQAFFDEVSMAMTMFGGVLSALVGMYIPDTWLKMRTKKRMEAFTDALPDALDLLVVSVESGMGLDQGIQRVAKEMKLSGPEVSGELYLLTLEMRAGKQRAEALRSLAERVGLDDLNSLVSLLIQADVFGISVGRTLRVYSETLRTKRYQAAEERAAKLPVKLMIPLILCILPALFAVIMGPAILMFIDLFKVLPG